MVKYDLCAAGEYEGWLRGFLRMCADQREQRHSRVPQTAVGEDLRVISTEDHRVKAGIIAVSALFQEEGVCFAVLSTARGTTIDDQISRIR